MTLDEAVQRLQNKYQINKVIDLSTFDALPSGKLYTELRKCHKDVFADNERLVFVAPGPLKKTYLDQPHDIITVLQQYIQTHDIPHFFVIVLTNIESMKTELEYVQKMYNPQEAKPILHIYYE